MSNSKKGKLSFKEKASYGVGAIGKDMACGIIFTYATMFFTDVLGLAAGFVGGLFFISKFWDAINDLGMGIVIQNTKTKWGKFRPWLLIGTILNSIILIIMFTDWGLSGQALYIFAAIIYVLWGMTYTIMDIPYWSMLPNLTSDPEERDKVAIIPRLFAAVGGSLIIAGFGVQIMEVFGSATDPFGAFTKFAWLIVIVFVVTILITVINVKSADRNYQADESERKITFKDMFNVIKKNDQLLIAIATILVWNGAGQFIGAIQLYYFKYAIGNESMFSYFALYGAVAVIGGLFVYPWVAKRLSRSQIYALAIIIPTIGLLMLGVIGLTDLRFNPFLTGLSGILWQFGGGLQTGIVTVVLADVVDYGEYKLGTRDESVIFSLQTLLVKLTSAFGVLITGFVLQATGYVPNQEQSANTIVWLRIVMIVIPIIFIIISFIIFKSKYKLNRKYMERIQTILSLRREGQQVPEEILDDNAYESKIELENQLERL